MPNFLRIRGFVSPVVIIAVILVAGLAILATVTRQQARKPQQTSSKPSDKGQLSLNRFKAPENSYESAVLVARFKNTITFSSQTHTVDSIIGGVNQDTLEALQKIGATKINSLFETTYKISLPKDSDIAKVAKTLSDTSSIAYAEPNYYLHIAKTPNDPKYSSQWGWAKIQAPEAWDITTGSSNVTVAVIDTGDSNHPDLLSNTIAGRNLFDESRPVTDTLSGKCEWARGHGTHVAGTIGAIGNNSLGVTGLNWNTKIMHLNIVDPNHPICDEPDDVLAKALRYTADNGIRVVNLSLGDEFSAPNVTNPQIVKEAVAYAISKNVVVVAAAGNNNRDVANFYPASYDGVIAVAASTPQDTKASFSNWGSRIDVAAPGVEILSTFPGGGYRPWEGTSMASPHVAGLAALMLSANSSLTPADVRQIIQSTADDLGVPGKDIYFGYGRINAKKAVEEARRRAGGGGSSNPGNPGNPGNPNPPADKGQVRGGVKTTTGSLVTTANIRIKLTRPDGSSNEATSLRDGTYIFAPEPYGQYTVAVSSYPQGTYSNPSPTSRSITLSSSDRTPTVDFTFTATSGGGGGGANCSKPSITGNPTDNINTFSITGIAYYQGSSPFDYNDRYKGCALVTLKQDGVVTYTVATAQDDGTYGFTGVAKGGNYTVELTPNADITLVNANPTSFTDLQSSATLINFRVTRK